MSTNLFAAFFLLTMLQACQFSKSAESNVIIINPDSLVNNIDEYIGSMIQTEGVIVHICGVDGKKMKLKTDLGNIITIIPGTNYESFDKSFYKQKIKVIGIAKETRLNKEYIDRQEKQKSLLCHIDNTPCKDTSWVNSKKNAGVSDSLSKIDIARMRDKMNNSKKQYYNVVSICAETIEFIDEE